MRLSLSFEKINYLVRPSKQVERKLFIEALHRLSKGGYNISNYRYLGFGSVFYADFILFHKFLYIDDMICVECEKDRTKRMKFNKPYRFIKLKMKPVYEVIPELAKKKKYVVWLDYDTPLISDILADIDGFLSFLLPGSIFIITVEAEPRLPDSLENELLSKDERESRLMEIYLSEFAKHVPHKPRKSDFSRNTFPIFLAEILRSQFETSLISRIGINFFQLFNFIYSDGTLMLTLGGMIEKEAEKDLIIGSGVFDLPFVNTAVNPKKISVPPLTIREKHWIDSQIKKGFKIKKKAFEIEDYLLSNYIDYYKHYPQYHEAIF